MYIGLYICIYDKSPHTRQGTDTSCTQEAVTHRSRHSSTYGHTELGVGGLHVDLIAGDLFTYIHPSHIFTFRRTQLKEPPSPLLSRTPGLGDAKRQREPREARSRVSHWGTEDGIQAVCPPSTPFHSISPPVSSPPAPPGIAGTPGERRPPPPTVDGSRRRGMGEPRSAAAAPGGRHGGELPPFSSTAFYFHR